MNKIISIITIFFISGCLPLFSKPQTPTIAVPEEFSGSVAGNHNSTSNVQNSAWWQQWHSDELNNLMTEALHGNPTMAEIRARLIQAKELAIQAGADSVPVINGSAGYARNEQHVPGKANIGADEWSLGLTMSYEVDLWHRIAATQNKASFEAKASREDLATAFISLSASITETWVSIITAQKELAILTEEQKLNQEILKLILVRFQQSQATILDINQQKQNMAIIANAMAAPRAGISLLKHRLALLIGRAPEDHLEISGTTTIVCGGDLPKPLQPQINIPAKLLINRPDIRAASLRLQAANWQNVQARADLLPKLSLSATYRHSATELSDIIDHWLLNLAANLTGPIYDGKRRRSEVKRTQAIIDERLATYKKIVLTALSEVEDSLTSVAQQEEILTAINQQIDLVAKTTKDIQRRYMGGASDFLPALREEVSIFNLRQEKIQAESNLLIANIGLHKALGGGLPPL